MTMAITWILCTINWSAVSAIISFLMIIVTAISIICNNSQSKKNREQQTDILRRQLKRSKLESLISISSKFISHMNPINVKILCRKIGRNEFDDEMGQIISSLENVYQEFCLIIGNDLSEMTGIDSEIEKLYKDYSDALCDIKDLSLIAPIGKSQKEITIENIKNRKEALDRFSPPIQELIISSLPDSSFESIAIARLDQVSNTSVKVHGLIEPIIRKIEQNSEI